MAASHSSLHFSRPEEDETLARPNYSHEKRLKDLARQKKQEEKRLRRQNKLGSKPDEAPPDAPPAPPAPDATPES